MSLKEIAQMTGVSVSTVGRILNDPKHKCSSEDIRRRVLEAARKINYIPNANARNLKSGDGRGDEIYSINILLTRFANEAADPFYDELLMLLEKELRNSGCIIANVWHNAEFSDEKASRSDNLTSIIDGLYQGSERKSDGLIIIGKVTRRALRALKIKEKNIVSINRNSTNYEVDEVLCDGSRIARDAVAYLRLHLPICILHPILTMFLIPRPMNRMGLSHMSISKICPIRRQGSTVQTTYLR